MRNSVATVPFELPAGWRNREHYHIALHQDGDDQVVEMTAFDDKADAKSRRYVFGKDGLLKNSSMERKSGGTKVELDWRFKKRGERYVIAWVHWSDRADDSARAMKFDYYDGPNGGALVKTITFWTLAEGDGEVVGLHDYVVDGTLVESTKAQPDGEGKPAETSPVPKTDK